MSQFYPQQNPYYPPPQRPEEDYYDDYEYDDGNEYYEDDGGGNPLTQRLLLVASGGCLLFICAGCCVLALMGLWVLDPGSSLVASPTPSSQFGLSFEDPAYANESVVNDENVQLTILEVNRNVVVPGIPPIEGQELLVVTIELVNLGSEEVSFNESDFLLINEFEEAYTISPQASAVDGALGRGKLAPNEGLEGRLVFTLQTGEVNLTLGWEGGRDVTPRYILIE
jgi:hypothetical protein